MTTENISDANVCSVCQSNVIMDDMTGEIVCTSCGVVVKDRLETLSPEWKSFSSVDYDDKTRTGFPSSLLIYDTGLSTCIGNSMGTNRQQNRTSTRSDPFEQEESSPRAKKEEGIYVQSAANPLPINRLRKLNAMSISSAPLSRNLKKATWEINRICSNLGLSLPLAERSAYFYRKSLQKNLIKGRSIAGFVAASIYLACKEKLIPRTIDEVCRATDTDKPFATHCYKILMSAMHIEPPITGPLRNIAKISTRVGIDERVSRRAGDILASISNHPLITGKNPVVLAAAAVYLATEENRLNITKTTIATAAEISTISLRKRLNDIMLAMKSRESLSKN